MVLGVVVDVGGLDGGGMLAALDGYAGLVDIEFQGVEGDRFDSAFDLERNVNIALIRPWLARLDVCEGDGVVGRLDAGKLSV